MGAGVPIGMAVLRIFKAELVFVFVHDLVLHHKYHLPGKAKHPRHSAKGARKARFHLDFNSKDAVTRVSRESLQPAFRLSGSGVVAAAHIRGGQPAAALSVRVLCPSSPSQPLDADIITPQISPVNIFLPI